MREDDAVSGRRLAAAETPRRGSGLSGMPFDSNTNEGPRAGPAAGAGLQDGAGAVMPLWLALREIWFCVCAVEIAVRLGPSTSPQAGSLDVGDTAGICSGCDDVKRSEVGQL
jgi:hypothetical protein